MTTHCTNCTKHKVYCVCCRHCGQTPEACTCNGYSAAQIADAVDLFYKGKLLMPCA